MIRRLLPVVAAALVSVAVLAGCSHASTPHPTATKHPTARATVGGGLPTAPASVAPSAAATPTVPVSAPTSSLVASATGSSVAIASSAGGSTTQTLANPQANGTPLVFLVLGQQSGWVHVALAQRPNGSSGWVRSSSVSISSDPYALVATTETNTLVLYENGVQQRTFSVATGTGGTPTPHGSFYLTELLAPTNAGYGPYAYGLSAFSDVLNSFGGGPGQIGLHGTNESSSIGTAASHGCIRLHNADITSLSKLLPLGTPIQIR